MNNNSQKELENIRIVYGRHGKEFALKVCEELKKKKGLESCQITDVETQQFANGEIKPKILDSIRRKDVYVIQRFHQIPYGINSDLMELYLLNDALVRETARSITNVLPFIPYCRQDKKVEPRVPISAKTIISFLEHQKVNRIMTIDLHSAAIQAFANLPIDNLYAKPVLAKIIQRDFNGNAVFISPDLGGASRAEAYARFLNVDYATIRKKRKIENRDNVMMREIEGKEYVEGKNAIIIDDMVDTASTVEKAVPLLKDNGAKEVFIFCTHPIMSPPAIERFKAQKCKLVATDSIPLPKEIIDTGLVKIVSVAPYFAEAIYRIQTGQSLSESEVLFPRTLQNTLEDY